MLAINVCGLERGLLWFIAVSVMRMIALKKEGIGIKDLEAPYEHAFQGQVDGYYARSASDGHIKVLKGIWN